MIFIRSFTALSHHFFARRITQEEILQSECFFGCTREHVFAPKLGLHAHEFSWLNTLLPHCTSESKMADADRRMVSDSQLDAKVLSHALHLEALLRQLDRDGKVHWRAELPIERIADDDTVYCINGKSNGKEYKEKWEPAMA